MKTNFSSEFESSEHLFHQGSFLQHQAIEGLNVTSSILDIFNVDYRDPAYNDLFFRASQALRKAAKLGHSRAKYELGFLLEYGFAIKKNHLHAIALYKKSAQQGDIKAQFRLGVIYREGEYIDLQQNNEFAVHWFTEAAKQGHIEAQYQLGLIYEHGGTGMIDCLKAEYWYQNAAKCGHPEAQYNLAFMYHYGHGLNKNIEDAIFWYGQAATNKDKYALFCLADLLLENGPFVEGQEEFEWLYKAAIKGHIAAQYELSHYFYSNKGSQKNNLQAYLWLSTIVAHGCHEGKFKLQEISQQLLIQMQCINF